MVLKRCGLEVAGGLCVAFIFTPLLLVWTCLSSAGLFLSSPYVLGALSVTAIATAQGTASSSQLSIALTCVSLASVIAQVVLWVALSSRGGGRSSREEGSLPLVPFFFLSIPASLFALVRWVLWAGDGGDTQVVLIAVCLFAPLCVLLSTTNLWLCRPSLSQGAVCEASLLTRTLQGTGITFTQGTSSEMHVIEFFNKVSSKGGDSPPLLLLHGYAGGGALFFDNFIEIVKAHDGPVISLDWKGCGLSPRKGLAWPTRPTLSAAEDFFTSPLLRFLDERGFEMCILLGHSLGGYLSTVFWMKHPERVAGLLLVSSAGWSSRDGDFKPPQHTTPQSGGGGGASASPSPPSHPGDDGGGSEATPSPSALPPPKRFSPPLIPLLLVRALFDGGCTPGIVVRGLGPLSLPCVSCSLRSRAKRWLLEHPWSEDTKRDLAGYMFAITATPGVGEHALSHLLAPGAYAREPLLPRVQKALEGGRLAPFVSTTPVLFLYGGSYDWMSISGGREAARVLLSYGARHASVFAVPRSGHHLYLENPTHTNAAIIEELAKIKALRLAGGKGGKK